MIDTDCYQLLNISPNADDKAIRRAYRERSKELHPDVNPSPNAAAQFAKLSQAVDTLLDPIERLKHDDRFGYHKKARSQDENAKQQFSDYQKNKAEHLVKEWSTDYDKAMEMRERQRLSLIEKHNARIKRIVAAAIVLFFISIVLLIIFATDFFAMP